MIKSNYMSKHFNKQFSLFIQKWQREKTVKYKGFSVVRDYSVTSFKVLGKVRVIIYNPLFFDKLTENQLFFLLEWGVRQYTVRNIKKSFRLTSDYCYVFGIEHSEIESLMTTISHFDLDELDYHLRWWQQIPLFFKKFFINIKLKIKQLHYGR